MRKALIVLVIFLALQFAVSGVLSILLVITSHASPSPSASDMPLAVSLLVVNLLTAVAVYLFLRLYNKKPLTGYLTRPTAGLTALTVAGLILLTFCINGVTELVNVPDILQSQFKGLMENPWGVLAVCLVGPIAEEITFRRGIMGSLMETEKWRKYALVLSAAIFGIIHFNPAQIIVAFSLGLFLGWLYLRTHSLVLPVLCHILNNSLSTLQADIWGYDTKMQDLLGGQTSLIITLVSAFLVTVALLLVLNKKLPHDKTPQDNQQTPIS